MVGPARYHSEIGLSTTCARRYSRRVLVLDKFQGNTGQGDGIAEHVYALAVPLGLPDQAVQLSVLQQWLKHQSLADIQRYVELAGAHHEWVSRL